MKDFNLDKAFMAVKAQRYEEGMQAYEAALQIKPSVDAWVGLGVCKLFQLLGNQTMEEVIYCFAQAREVEGADKEFIELQLISYSALVAEQASSYCVSLIDEIIQAEKNVANAVIMAGIAGGLAASSKTLSGSVVTGAIAAASGGVAIGQLGEITNHKTAAQVVMSLIDTIHENLTKYLVLTSQHSQAVAFNSRLIELKKIVQDASLKGLQSSSWYNTGWLWFWLIIFWPVFIYGLIMRIKNK